MTNNFDSFTDAYLNTVNAVLKNGEWVEGVTDPMSVGSHFGKKNRRTKELLVHSFCVNNPRDRNLYIEGLEINTKYAIANFLWMIYGNDNGSVILPFNENGSKFVDETNRLHSALGPHIFKLQKNSFFEFEKVEKILKDDPSSRRAVIQLFKQTDLSLGIKDVPCYNHLQFFVRKNYLHCHVVMRSQSALKVLPYDYFLFSLLHEALSVRLNTHLGKLYYSSNSIHIYEDEIDQALLVKKKKNYNSEVSYMGDFTNGTINKLGDLFLQISTSYLNNNLDINSIVMSSPIDIYWKNLILSNFNK